MIIMTLKIKKIIGWLLLVIGLTIIFWALYSSYNIFTAKTAAPEIFKGAEKEEDFLVQKKTTEFEQELEKMFQEQLKEMLPTSFAPQLFNLIAWSIFGGILIFGGGKIAAIGVKLIRQK